MADAELNEDAVVVQPTYMANIRYFFSSDDIDHMSAKGIDLGTYEGVKRNALAVYAHTAPPNADMPPASDAKWSVERSQTFKNWIISGYPLGAATPSPQFRTLGGPPTRLRKNITSMTEREVESLRVAFTGIMARAPEDATSYFALAGHHGLPESWCLHHEDRYNPWHRVYLRVFEDALRSVPGCDDVTLPYWDFEHQTLPKVLQQPPFASYALPKDPGSGASPPQPGEYFPYTTQRFAPAMIKKNLQTYGVYDDIATSRTQSRWGAYNNGGYQDFSIQAHDGGHVSIGPTMAEQNVSAYDPVFWFFHCNLDRLWLQWQQNVQATTLAGFKTTVDGDVSWLSTPFNALPPFTTTADGAIPFGISYEPAVPETALENMVGNVAAARAFWIGRSTPVSVRVKGIDRLNIPGSFAVKLLADGAPVATRAFFQPRSPKDCDNCRNQALINIDFRVEHDVLVDRTLSVEIEVIGQEEIGARFPLSQAGNPTINARLLLQDV